MVLNDGDQPPGIYGYYDMFTWAGWWEVWMTSSFIHVLEDWLFATVVAGVFIFYGAMVDADIPYC